MKGSARGSTAVVFRHTLPVQFHPDMPPARPEPHSLGALPRNLRASPHHRVIAPPAAIPKQRDEYEKQHRPRGQRANDPASTSRHDGSALSHRGPDPRSAFCANLLPPGPYCLGSYSSLTSEAMEFARAKSLSCPRMPDSGAIVSDVAKCPETSRNAPFCHCSETDSAKQTQFSIVAQTPDLSAVAKTSIFCPHQKCKTNPMAHSGTFAPPIRARLHSPELT